MYTTAISPTTARTFGKRPKREKNLQFFSKKNGFEIRNQSRIELATAYSLELNHKVKNYLHQPCVIELNTCKIFKNKDDAKASLKGVFPPSRLKFYTPDFHAVHRDGEVIYECKETDKLEEFREKAELAIKACVQAGIRYQILTEEDVLCEPFFSNIETFKKQAFTFPLWDKTAVIQVLKKTTPKLGAQVSISELSRVSGLHPADILKLCMIGRLGFDCRSQDLFDDPILDIQLSGLQGLI